MHNKGVDLHVALRNISRTKVYSEEELDSIGLLDRRIINPDNCIFYMEGGNVFGASVLHAYKRAMNLPIEESELYFDLFTLAVMFQSDEAIKIANEKGLIRRIKKGQYEVPAVHLDNFWHFAGLLSEDNDGSRSPDSLDDLIRQIPAIKLGIGELRYISEHRYEDDEEIGIQLGIPAPIVKAAKLKGGFVHLGDTEIRLLIDKLYYLRHPKTGKLSEEEKNILKRRYPYVPTHQLVDSIKRDVDTIDLEARMLGLKKIKPGSDYTIPEIMEICSLPYEELDDAILQGNLKSRFTERRVFREQEEDQASKGVGNYSDHFLAYTLFIKGGDLIEYLKAKEGSLLQKSRRLTRIEKIKEGSDHDEKEDEVGLVLGVPKHDKRGKLAGYTKSGVNIYHTFMREVGEIPLLGWEEEIEISRKVKEGDYVALNDLIEANLKLVVSIARRVYTLHMDMLDRVQEGMIGLIKAAHLYNPEYHNFRFPAYASWLIKKAIFSARANYDRGIRLPSHYFGNYLKVINYHIKKITESGEEPSAEEVHEATGVSLWFVNHLRTWDKPYIISLEDSIKDTGSLDDSKLGEFIADKSLPPIGQILENSSLSEKLEDLLNKLPELEREVLRRRFGFHKGDAYGQEETLESIGDSLGITRERVRQIEDIALDRLRSYKESEMLEDLID